MVGRAGKTVGLAYPADGQSNPDLKMASSTLKPVNNLQLIRRVLWITLLLNLVATIAKLIVGYWTGSLSLIADGYDSVFDAASNVIGLIGIFIASRPADEEHPYGHRKAESLTTLVIAMLLFLTTWELIKSGVERLLDPALIQTEVSVWSFGALALSIVVHLSVVLYELRAGRRLKSDVLVADALHTRADIFVSVSVIGGLIAVRLGYAIADPVLALVISLVIAKIGIDIIRESASPLMDRAVMPADEALQIAMSVPGVVSSHRVRSRGQEGAVYADLHIRVDPELTTVQAHAIAHEVQHRLRERRPEIQDVTIHVEPGAPPGQSLSRESITIPLRRIADGLGVAIHSVWANEVGGKYYTDVHLEVDGSLSLSEAHAQASLLERRALADVPQLATVTTHIEPRGDVRRAASLAIGGQAVADAVRRIVGEATGVEECHDVEVGESGEGWRVSLHCSLPGEVALTEAHRTISQLEGELRERVPGLDRVLIHAEPVEP
jgi:cation diffusion facilitator family transporter